MLKAIGSKIVLTDSNAAAKGYYSLVSDLIDNEIVQKMKDFPHHGRTSCFQHCLNVSYYNYKLCKFFSLDVRSAARAGLLHDLFLYDWHNYIRSKGERLHGFTHAKTALYNVRQNFDINEVEADIIEKHMFPVNLLAIPKYRETVIIVLVDKYCGSIEVLDHRIRQMASMLSKLPLLNLVRRKKLYLEVE